MNKYTVLLLSLILFSLSGCSTVHLKKNNELPVFASEEVKIEEGEMVVTFAGLFNDTFVDLVVDGEKMMLKANPEIIENFKEVEKGEKIKVYYEFDNRSGDISNITGLVNKEAQKELVKPIFDEFTWIVPDNFSWDGKLLTTKELSVEVTKPFDEIISLNDEKTRAVTILGDIDYKVLETPEREAEFIYYTEIGNNYTEIWVKEIEGQVFRFQTKVAVENKDEKISDLKKIVNTISKNK